MFSKCNHLLYLFSITIHLHLASFYEQNREILIEQTTEFQSKGLGPFGRTCTPITGVDDAKSLLSAVSDASTRVNLSSYIVNGFCRKYAN